MTALVWRHFAHCPSFLFCYPEGASLCFAGFSIDLLFKSEFALEPLFGHPQWFTIFFLLLLIPFLKTWANPLVASAKV
jgi:hypothetical protein